MSLPADSFEYSARRYIESALPHGTPYERQKLLEDWCTKEQIAPGILSDFVKRAGDPQGKRVLDLGFGNGITLATFAKGGAHMSGLEVSPELLAIGDTYVRNAGISADMRLYDGEVFPFPDASFEYVYSVSVFEHVTNPIAVLREIHRILVPGGKFYLAFPNRITPKETHTGLYFISYLPRTLAGNVLSLFKRNSLDDWNLHFLDYFWLIRLLKKNRIPLYVQFETESPSILKRSLKKILAFFNVHQSAFLPHVMVVLVK